MTNKNESLYLDLLKKVLIDFESVNSYDYHPLEIVNPNWKTAFLYPIDMLLRKRNFAITKLKYISEGERINGLDWPARAKTMIGLKRLNNTENCVRTIIDEGINGNLIETGVWKGGATIFMKAILNEFGIKDRIIWLADSFQGVSKSKENEYAADKGNKLHSLRILKVSKNKVENNFRKFNLFDNNIKFLQGWFSETLPNAPVEKLSLIRLDDDLYESTILALQHLYYKLSDGGFVIVDDYNAFPGGDRF